MKKITICLFALMAVICATAQEAFFESREDTIVRKAEHDVHLKMAIGSANVLDTYLSDETFRGVGMKMVYAKVRDRREKPMVYTFHNELSYYSTDNRNGGKRDYSLNYGYTFGLQYRWFLCSERLQLRAGGMAEGGIGGSYNEHNAGNNPAQGRCFVNVGAMLSASYSFAIGRLPLRISYELRMPLAGLMFSPMYKQSYYELFVLGNYDRNIVFTTVATPQIWQQVAVDFKVQKATAIRLSYISDVRQATPNGLKQHQYFNGLSLGVVLRR